MMHLDEQLLLAYADGERDPEMEAHVSSCADCAEHVRLLEAGRDALRAAPLLELPEAWRRAMIAELPERERRWAGLRERRAPALAAAAALVLVAGLVALATLAGGGGGGDEEGAGGGGGGASGGAAESAPDSAAGDTTRATLDQGLGKPVRSVRGPVEAVLRTLQREGIPAVRRNGSVVATGDREDVLAALAGRPGGRIAVYVR